MILSRSRLWSQTSNPTNYYTPNQWRPQHSPSSLLIWIVCSCIATLSAKSDCRTVVIAFLTHVCSDLSASVLPICNTARIVKSSRILGKNMLACVYEASCWNFVWLCLSLPVIGPAQQVILKDWRKLSCVIPLLLQYQFTKISHGFFGLRDDYSRNESTEFVMCLLFFC